MNDKKTRKGFMAISLHPSRLINDLEHGLYKGVSRAKADNQKSTDTCITQMDKLTQQKTTALEREYIAMVALAVGILAFAALGVVAQWKAESANFKLESANYDLPRLEEAHPLHQTTQDAMQGLRGNAGMENLKKEMVNFHDHKMFFSGIKGGCEGVSQFNNALQQVIPAYSKISQNQLDHEYRKREIRLQQLSQERSNSPEQSTLNDVKDMKRRQQQARSAVG